MRVSERPIYETEADRLREINPVGEFITHLSKTVGVEFSGKRFPELHCADWCVKGPAGVDVGWIEYKDRSNFSLPDLMQLGGPFIHERKYNELMEAQRMYGVRVWLLTSYSDGLYYLPLAKGHSTTTMVAGRTDRQDPQDITNHTFFTEFSDWHKVPKGEQ